MDLTQTDVIQRLKYRLSLGDGGTTLTNKMKSVISDALKEFGADIPAGIAGRTQRVGIPADVTSTTVNASIITTADPWVLEIRKADGTVLGTGTTTGWLPNVAGQWDGLMHIEVATSSANDARIYSFKTRYWKQVASVSGAEYDRYYVSLVKPWPNHAAGSHPITTLGTFRIFSDVFYLPSETLKVTNATVFSSNTQRVLNQLSEPQATSLNVAGYRGDNSGSPTAFWASDDFNMIAAQFTPTLSAQQGASWVGPWQEGTYTFRYTYVWGKTDIASQASPHSVTVNPLIESSPSPVSASFNHASGSNGGRPIVITLPNIAGMLNFGDSGTLRYGMTGIRKRIYVSQTAVRTAGAGTLNEVETEGVYVFLAEVDDITTSYTWNGSVIPDKEARLVSSTGAYKTFKLYPRPDAFYEIDFKIQSTPPAILADYDPVPIETAYQEAFIRLCLAKYREMDHDAAGAANDRAFYNSFKTQLVAGRGNPAKVAPMTRFGGRRQSGSPGPLGINVYVTPEP